MWYYSVKALITDLHNIYWFLDVMIISDIPVQNYDLHGFIFKFVSLLEIIESTYVSWYCLNISDFFLKMFMYLILIEISKLLFLLTGYCLFTDEICKI